MCDENSISSSDGPKCPYCGYVHQENEDWIDHVTYWGSEDGPAPFECGSCDLTFRVYERVVREWESRPMVQSKAMHEDNKAIKEAGE